MRRTVGIATYSAERVWASIIGKWIATRDKTEIPGHRPRRYAHRRESTCHTAKYTDRLNQMYQCSRESVEFRGIAASTPSLRCRRRSCSRDNTPKLEVRSRRYRNRYRSRSALKRDCPKCRIGYGEPVAGRRRVDQDSGELDRPWFKIYWCWELEPKRY